MSDAGGQSSLAGDSNATRRRAHKPSIYSSALDDAELEHRALAEHAAASPATAAQQRADLGALAVPRALDTKSIA
jgi:hypothetical protein